MGVTELGSTSSTPAPTRHFTRASHRPRLLLVVDVYLLVLAVALTYWLIGSLLADGFGTDPAKVPPFVANAELDAVWIALALVLPLVLVAITGLRVRFASRLTWPWTPLIAAWLIVAFTESLIGGPDFTAAVLLLGVFPAVAISHEQDYLRREAGQSPVDAPWSPLRRRLTAIIALIVVAWVVVYVVAGVMGISDFFGPLPFGWPGVQLPGGVGVGPR
jgi:hypothetical protein